MISIFFYGRQPWYPKLNQKQNLVLKKNHVQLGKVFDYTRYHSAGPETSFLNPLILKTEARHRTKNLAFV